MLSPDILKKIRQIEIHTKRLLSGVLVGDYNSARKGSGFEFDRIREYQVGDDVRFIDWKSSAKTNKLLFKQYIEERNRNVVIAVDVSSSGLFSSNAIYKLDLMKEVSAVLALIAEYGKDQATLLLFADEVEFFVPPGRGKQHIHTIMRHLFTYKSERKKTDLNCVLRYIAGMGAKDSVIFLISDFIDTDFEQLLNVAARKHEIVAVRCLDDREKTFPDVGFLTIDDVEEGQQMLLDTRKKSGSDLRSFLRKRLSDQARLLKKNGIDYLEVSPGKPFIGDLIRFFRRRMMY